VVFDRVNDAVVADADAPLVYATDELLASTGPRIVGQFFDAGRDTRHRRTGKLGKLLFSAFGKVEIIDSSQRKVA
jgi:hypothetical protein